MFDKKRRLPGLGILACLLLPGIHPADAVQAAVPIYRTETPPVIDGKLDDPLWQQATQFDRFVTFKPDFGKPTSEKTIVRVAYDRKNIYFA
ncbi:MAG TPA: hypothetical protein VLQ89_02080, partial [Candidatus Binatia bacterium]|nr:hypothetical protein [Candidatus Binatia bacterium]